MASTALAPPAVDYLPNLAETDEQWERAQRGWRRAERERQQETQKRQQAESRLAREVAARRAAQARVAELEDLLNRAGDGARPGT